MENTESTPMVVQSNRLIEARYSLNVSAQRLIAYTISLIHKDDKDFQEYEIEVLRFAEILNITSKDIYNKIDEITKNITTSPIHIPTEDGYINTTWASSAQYHAGKGTVTLTFDRKLKPYLLELKEQFTQYRLIVLSNFTGKHTTRIYALLKQYETIKERYFELDNFKSMLGLEDKYPKFSMLKKWVLLPAKREFEKKDKKGFNLVDITFDFEPKKSGTRIVGIHFKIISQQYQESLAMLLSPAGDEINILQELKNLGVSHHKAHTLTSEYSHEYLKDKILLTKEKERKNVSGFLVKAIESDWMSTKSTQRKKAKEYIKGHKKKLLQMFAKRWNEHIIDNYKDYQLSILLETLNDSILQEIKSEAEKEYEDTPLPKNMKEAAINGTYKQLVEKRFLKQPSLQKLISYRDSTPSPDAYAWDDEPHLRDEMKKYIDEFTTQLQADDSWIQLEP